MKNRSLFSLIFMLLLHQHCFAQKPEFIFQKNLPSTILHYAIGLFGIKACNSKNAMEIKANAAVNSGYSCYLMYRDLQNLKTIYQDFNMSDSLGKAGYTILSFMSVQSLAEHAQFFYQNMKLFKKSKEVAKFNKAIQLNLKAEKIKQVAWLTFNTILPYMCYAAKRMYYDNVTLKNAFYKDANTLLGSALISSSETTLFTASIVASLLENQRRHALYKKIRREAKRKSRQSF